ncbi:hypothetical protein GCM10022198_19110 [Klugiella xanthotipulae]|uniref:Uncharacterized protein DUF2017 n=1 Tax=Klugiella xanthotipulae TaxID=244735 RepID=A0A543HRY6_9MICO|nr:DUF2017 family protein [Klugiella xanthotipulae]TQM61111.1 uncharacterized protein DUF2017 [Klugiella xanthotipulae]
MRISRINAEGFTVLHIHEDEADLVETLVAQLVSLYRDYSTGEPDPDPLLASLDLGGASSAPADPALARLLPDAYEDDTLASEFRQTSERGIVNRKIQDADNVLALLGAARLDGIDQFLPDEETTLTHDDLPAFGSDTDSRVLSVPLDEHGFLSWVKTLTAMRLALAARLAIDTENDLEREPLDDMEANTRAVYDWLAEFTEALLSAQRS